MPELRSALETLDVRLSIFCKNKEVSSDEKLVQAYVKAVKYMSPRKMGPWFLLNRPDLTRADCDWNST